jgi:GT2 family glycosyltransferase
LTLPVDGPPVSVVIATRDRTELLRRLAVQLIEQLAERDELVIVDDAAVAPAPYEWLGSRGRVIASHGRGPAVARNLGWRSASCEVVAFTDDDVRLDQGWLDACRSEFARDPTLVALEGRTFSRAFDVLYEYSVQSETARNGLTCNVAYTRAALERLDGFDEGFPFPHCEDLDLFTRARRLGRVRFSDAMLVEHMPRRIVPRAFARRAAWLHSERRLYSKHPELKPYAVAPLLCAILEYVYWPLGNLFRSPGPSLMRDPARLGRAAVLASWWWWHVALGLVHLSQSGLRAAFTGSRSSVLRQR